MAKPTAVRKVAKKIAKKTFGRGYNRAVLPKHYGVAIGANIKRRFPARGLSVVGVTGTNGKTTTCRLIHQILHQAGYQVGLMTTTSYGVNDRIKAQSQPMTTSPIEVTLDRIVQMKRDTNDQLQYLVIEVTSQALDQFRLLGVPIDIAVLTNVSHEHLDYHQTFRRYLTAKLKLFKATARHKSGRQLGVINHDDPNAVCFIDVVPNVALYSLKDQSQNELFDDIVYPQQLKLNNRGSQFLVEIGPDKYKINCRLPGQFNVANCLAAILVGRAIGLTVDQISDGIKSLLGVDGRMEAVVAGQNFDLIVDFAHNSDGFQKVFDSLGATDYNRLITVFGAGGDRDTNKRYLMGKVAGWHSDIVILTEDNSRSEPTEKIIDQISRGASAAGMVVGKDLFIEPDRLKAIKLALTKAKAKDVVLLLGKGHEKTLIRPSGEIPWQDTEVAKKLLKQLKVKKVKTKPNPKKTTAKTKKTKKTTARKSVKSTK